MCCRAAIRYGAVRCSRAGHPRRSVPRPGWAGRPPHASSGAWPACAPFRLRRSVHLRAAPNQRRPEGGEGGCSKEPCGPLACCECACHHGPERAERRTGPQRRTGPPISVTIPTARAFGLAAGGGGGRARVRAAEHSRSATGIHITMGFCRFRQCQCWGNLCSATLCPSIGNLLHDLNPAILLPGCEVAFAAQSALAFSHTHLAVESRNTRQGEA
jgi:hypothetical protein